VQILKKHLLSINSWKNLFIENTCNFYYEIFPVKNIHVFFESYFFFSKKNHYKIFGAKLFAENRY